MALFGVGAATRCWCSTTSTDSTSSLWAARRQHDFSLRIAISQTRSYLSSRATGLTAGRTDSSRTARLLSVATKCPRWEAVAGSTQALASWVAGVVSAVRPVIAPPSGGQLVVPELDLTIGTGAAVRCLGKGRRTAPSRSPSPPKRSCGSGRANEPDRPTSRCSPHAPVDVSAPTPFNASSASTPSPQQRAARRCWPLKSIRTCYGTAAP
jgi:hypothetical protein